MNYYRASQRTSDKRWDFTHTRDKYTTPAGYCSGWREWTEADYARVPGLKEEVEKKLLPFKDKFHVDGHETAAEACACYRQYLLDTQSYLDGDHPDHQNKCEICGVWTTKYATVDHDSPISLCDEHRTSESLEKLYHQISSITSSY